MSRNWKSMRSATLAVTAAALVGGSLVGGSGVGSATASPAPTPDPDKKLMKVVVDLLPAKRVDVPAGLPRGTQCYTAKGKAEGKSGYGYTIFTIYTVGGWCHAGNRVVSSWFVDAGGETSTPGWRYEGVRHKGSAVVGNEGRSFSQHKFVYGIGGWDVQSPTPCVRVKGLAEPRAMIDTQCSTH